MMVEVMAGSVEGDERNENQIWQVLSYNITSLTAFNTVLSS